MVSGGGNDRLTEQIGRDRLGENVLVVVAAHQHARVAGEQHEGNAALLQRRLQRLAVLVGEREVDERDVDLAASMLTRAWLTVANGPTISAPAAIRRSQ